MNVQNQTNSKDTKEVPKIPKDFDQLVVSNMDKKTSQLFQYKGLKLEKHSEYDMFYLQSVIQNLKKHYVERHTVESFINSYSFYVQLRLLDRRLPKYGNVYLLIDKEKKTCKVGMSYNIAKRYSKMKLDKELVYVLPVKNMKVTESKLIKHFNQLYGKPVKGNETFTYTNADTVKEEFMNTIKNDVVKIDIHKDIPQHFMRFKSSLGRTGIWCGFEVAMVIFSYFIENERDRDDMIDFMAIVRYIIDKDAYVYITYNKALKTDVEFVLFHKYRLMRNKSDNYVNASSLYNSLKKHGKCKVPYRNFKTFLLSNRFQFRIKQLKKAMPDEPAFYFHKNEKQKFLEGYYIHYALVHFIIDNIDAEYAINTSVLIFNIYSNNLLSSYLPYDKIKTSYSDVNRILNINEINSAIDIQTLYSLTDLCVVPQITGGADKTIPWLFIVSIIVVVIVVTTIVTLNNTKTCSRIDIE